MEKIRKYLKENLNLELNRKSNYYPSKIGLDFCGYRIFTTHRLLRKSSKNKIKKNIKTWNKLNYQKKLNTKYVIESINSWIGHIKHCNSYKLKVKVLDNCIFLYNQKNMDKKIELESIELIENDKNRIKNNKVENKNLENKKNLY